MYIAPYFDKSLEGDLNDVSTHHKAKPARSRCYKRRCKHL